MEAEILVSGNVGAAVEWRDHEEYEGRAAFSVACTPRMRRQGVWVDLPTTWYRVTCWRRLAVHVRDSICKGDAVLVGGRLRLDRWVDEAGSQKESYSIDATWVAHDLRRGTTSFERKRSRPEAEEPAESDFKSDRARDLAEAEEVVRSVA